MKVKVLKFKDPRSLKHIATNEGDRSLCGRAVPTTAKIEEADWDGVSYRCWRCELKQRDMEEEIRRAVQEEARRAVQEERQRFLRSVALANESAQKVIEQDKLVTTLDDRLQHAEKAMSDIGVPFALVELVIRALATTTTGKVDLVKKTAYTDAWQSLLNMGWWTHIGNFHYYRTRNDHR